MNEAVKQKSETEEPTIEKQEMENLEAESQEVEKLEADVANEASELQNEAEEVAENIESAEEEIVTPATNKKIKKHTAAKQLVDDAKSIVDESEKDINNCKLLLENDLRNYKDAKDILNSEGLESAKTLLISLGHATEEELETIEEPEFVVEDTVEPVIVRDVNSGRFTGFILSLVAGAATLGGLLYVASQKLGTALTPEAIQEKGTITNISNWYANTIGMEGNTQAGMALVALVVLLVMAIVYMLRVGRKGTRNLDFATQQMEEVKEYASKKLNCKEQMDKVDAHINDSIDTLEDYLILLNEQNGKLRRMLHFEKEQAEVEASGYKKSSVTEMEETKKLIVKVQSFIAQPVLGQGKLLEEAPLALEEAKKAVEAFLNRT